MKKADYERAKAIELDIAEIEQLLKTMDKEKTSYDAYTLTCVNERSRIKYHLGDGFLSELRRQTADAFTLRKLKLEKELSLLIEL